MVTRRQIFRLVGVGSDITLCEYNLNPSSDNRVLLEVATLLTRHGNILVILQVELRNSTAPSFGKFRLGHILNTYEVDDVLCGWRSRTARVPVASRESMVPACGN